VLSNVVSAQAVSKRFGERLAVDQLDRASRHLDLARSQGTTDIEVLLDIAEVDIRRQRGEAAVALLESLESRAPTPAQLLRAGRLAGQAGAGTLAADLFTQVVARAPDDAEAWAQLGLTYLVANQ